jgi:hypothetical protein
VIAGPAELGFEGVFGPIGQYRHLGHLLGLHLLNELTVGRLSNGFHGFDCSDEGVLETVLRVDPAAAGGLSGGALEV